MNMWDLSSLLHSPDAEGDATGGDASTSTADDTTTTRDSGGNHAAGLRAELSSERKKRKAADDRLAELEKAEAERKKKDAEAQGKYQELAQQHEAEAAKAKADLADATAKIEQAERDGKARDALLAAGVAPARMGDAILLFGSTLNGAETTEYGDLAKSFVADREFLKGAGHEKTGDGQDGEGEGTSSQRGTGKRGGVANTGASKSLEAEYKEAHKAWQAAPNDNRAKAAYYALRDKMRKSGRRDL